jgi:colanic acid/amylovoran biosynthesis glycosyltransferase
MTLSVMQALATGLPAITTRHSGFPDQIIGFPDQIIEGKDGYMVEEGDYRALAEKILLYMSEPERWGAMGRFGRDLMKQTYDSEVLVNKQVDLYRSLTA